jgi:hypothetical protein
MHEFINDICATDCQDDTHRKGLILEQVLQKLLLRDVCFLISVYLLMKNCDG